MNVRDQTEANRICDLREKARRIVDDATISGFASRFPEQIAHAVEVVRDFSLANGHACHC